MRNGQRKMEDRMREHFKGSIKETLATKGQRRWIMLETLALGHDYTKESSYSYRHENKYLMKIDKIIVYAEDIEPHECEKMRELLEQKAKIQTSPSLIANALTMGGSTLGGAFLGYLLIRAGLHPLVLIPAIIVPPGLCIYDMLKQSTKESGKLAKIDTFLNKYRKNIYYDDDAVKRFYYRIYKNALVNR